MTRFSKDFWALSWIGRWHQSLVFGRRARVLTKLLAERIPQGANVLDIGCGDGTIGNMLAQSRPDIRVEGVETSVRLGCRIPCLPFDGKRLPYPDRSFDVCLLVDVLHHIEDIKNLLQETVRVSGSLLLIKDHVSESLIDHATLRFMDWVGNRHHGVPLPYNYQSRSSWGDLFSAVHLNLKTWQEYVPIYPFPMNSIFGRALHFVALFEKSAQASRMENK
jgi:SAM-dependent methyltransferase